MNKNHVIIGLIAVAVFVAGALYIVLGNQGATYSNDSVSTSTTTGNTGTPTGSTNTTSSGSSKSYTLAQVATHNSASSCWSTINGNVYDLTSWISQHPGGEGAILSICGKDGTSAFENQHGDNGRANQVLGTFLIGSLSK